MIRYLILILFLFAQTISAQPQKAVELNSQVGKLYESASATIFFDLKEIPTVLIERIDELNDSITYAILAYDGKSVKKQKSSQEMIARLKDRSKTDKFIAGNREKWRATDVVSAENEKWPTRKFLFGVSAGDNLVFFYWHGGIGKHLHIVLVEDKNYLKPTGFVTLNNWDILNKLDYEGRLRDIKSTKLDPFAKPTDICVQRGRVSTDIDPF